MLEDLLGPAASSSGGYRTSGGGNDDSLGERLREGVESVVMMANEMAVLQRQVGVVVPLEGSYLALCLPVGRQVGVVAHCLVG